MKPIALGKSQLKISQLGMGCMGMSEFYGVIDDKESIKTIQRAFELGINHFDTADIYGFGHNEKLLGQAIKPYRDKVVIATKCGIKRDKADPTIRDICAKPEYIKKCCEDSLTRLGTDYIDLFYIHRMDIATPIEESMYALSQLVEEGKILNIGLSEVNVDIIKRANAVHQLTAIQSEYSLWSRAVEKEIIPLCKTLNIGFVAYSPIGRGFLSGKIKSVDSLHADDSRRSLPRFQKENIKHNQKDNNCSRIYCLTS